MCSHRGILQPPLQNLLCTQQIATKCLQKRQSGGVTVQFLACRIANFILLHINTLHALTSHVMACSSAETTRITAGRLALSTNAANCVPTLAILAAPRRFAAPQSPSRTGQHGTTQLLRGGHDLRAGQSRRQAPGAVVNSAALKRFQR
eukprot:m.199515 g.199515  ORF g.199515 m.199515 type:complete len:148 (+) comp15317_c0_seq3:364-807(+)